MKLDTALALHARLDFNGIATGVSKPLPVSVKKGMRNPFDGMKSNVCMTGSAEFVAGMDMRTTFKAPSAAELIYQSCVDGVEMTFMLTSVGPGAASGAQWRVAGSFAGPWLR